MGKIADALDKIDTLEKLGTSDITYSQEYMEEESTLSKSSSDSAVEKVVNQAEVSEVGDQSTKESTSPKVPADIPIKNIANPIETTGKWEKRLFNAVNKDSAMPEIFKTLRSQILHPLDGRKVPKSIMVASSVPKEGKSFLTANLGISIANGMDQHCLLVDCDLRHPTLARSLGIETKYGLVNYLRDQVDLAGLIVKTSIPKLSILPSGNKPNNPAELLSSSRMHTFIKEVSNRYEDRVIIFDSPPMLMAAESLVLAGQVDAIILVVRRGRAKKHEVEKFITTVDKNKILGIVFNDHISNYLDKSVVEAYGYGY